MAFDTSLVRVQPERPWRYTTLPTYNPDGSEATPGVKQTLNGVFILLSPELVDRLKTELTAAQKDELQSYVHPLTVAEAGEWHVPVWAGEQQAHYIRVPAAIWNDPSTPPPARVKQLFRWLWRESQAA
jgi:hypothetical protein